MNNSEIECKKKLLETFKAFDAFCRKHDINYYAAYGTLISAVRHKGLIPWDDDVDVVMLRADYNKFIKTFQDTGKYKLFSAEHRNMYGAIARLCEMEQTRVEMYAPMFSESTGVWIDIFPLDYIEDNREILLNNMQQIFSIHNDTIMKRCLMKTMWRQVSGIRSFIHWMKMKIKYRRNVFYYVYNHLLFIKNIVSDDGSLICQFGYPVYKERDIVNRIAFDDVEKVSFEGELFYAMKGYDEWLRNI